MGHLRLLIEVIVLDIIAWFVARQWLFSDVTNVGEGTGWALFAFVPIILLGNLSYLTISYVDGISDGRRKRSWILISLPFAVILFPLFSYYWSDQWNYSYSLVVLYFLFVGLAVFRAALLSIMKKNRPANK